LPFLGIKKGEKMGERLRLRHQVKQALDKIHRRGASRHEAKQGKKPTEFVGIITGDKTFKDYSDVWRRCLDHHSENGGKMSKQNFQDVGKKLALDYLEDCKKRGLAAYTLKAYRSGLNSILQNKITDKDVELPIRRAEDITRGRKERPDWVKEKYADDIRFIEATGVRLSVYKRLTASDIKNRGGHLCCRQQNDKGGKNHWAPVLRKDEDWVREFIKNRSTGLLASRGARVLTEYAAHKDRRTYARALYKEYVAAGYRGRLIKSRSRGGRTYYADAVAKLSVALGHGKDRTDITTKYLRGND
jgi:integrase